MRAGRLRHRVVFEKNVPTEDTDGGLIDNWIEQFKVSGEVLELRGREYLAAREVHSEVTARIRIRYRSEIEPLMWRAIHLDTGRTYNIEHVVDLAGRRRELELMVSEIQ